MRRANRPPLSRPRFIFLSYSDERKMRGGCRRVDRSESREKRESPRADIREGERSASGEERSGRLIGVSRHSASGPTAAEWRLRDEAEACRARPAPRGLLLPCRLPLSLPHRPPLPLAIHGPHCWVSARRWTWWGMEEVTLPDSAVKNAGMSWGRWGKKKKNWKKNQSKIFKAH